MTHSDRETTDGGSPSRQPGWYPDPWYHGQHRLWTGSRWTADVFPDGPGIPTAHIAETTARYGPPPTERAPTAPAPPWYGPEQVSGPAASRAVPEVLASPPRRVAPRWLIGAAATGLGLVIGFTAVYATTGRSTATGNASGRVPVPPPTSSASPADPAADVLNELVVHPADVPAGVSVFVIPGGDQVGADQPTLDLCNGTYPSESLRTARLQVAAATSSSATVLSTEAVLYRSPAAAAQALSELRSVSAKCPDTPVTSPVGEPTVTTTFGSAPDVGWSATPGVERQAYDVTSTDQSGQSEHSVAVYLRRGRVLLALYLPRGAGTPQVDVSGKTALSDISASFAARLARLPASVTSGG